MLVLIWPIFLWISVLGRPISGFLEGRGNIVSSCVIDGFLNKFVTYLNSIVIVQGENKFFSVWGLVASGKKNDYMDQMLLEKLVAVDYSEWDLLCSMSTQCFSLEYLQIRVSPSWCQKFTRGPLILREWQSFWTIVWSPFFIWWRANKIHVSRKKHNVVPEPI